MVRGMMGSRVREVIQWDAMRCKECKSDRRRVVIARQ
jgi:hypothetical protein